MDFKKMSRKATWLIPGLSIKRWIFIAIAGLTLIVLGLALLFSLQPITLLIRVLQKLALIMPSNLSGPFVIFAGLALLYIGASKTYKTFISAMGGGKGVLLEALYRQYKLAHGPRIVAIGGGTGLSTLLRGIKNYTSNITAVVTVGDDGGSSGRLRKEQGIIPPGDIRNCIAALADEEQLITALFQYRFQSGPGLEGHSFGNLFLTAMCRVTGDMMSAIKESSNVLNIRGRVLPSTLDNIMLSAELADGSIVHGESDIPKAHGMIQRVFCSPENPTPLPDVLKAIEEADLIILGPGSLYTSVIPNLLIREIAQAIAKSHAPTIYVANIMTQSGETDHLTVGDHVQAILNHLGDGSFIDAVFVNNWLPQLLVDRYKDVDSIPVERDDERCEAMGVELVARLLVDETDSKMIRHHSKRLARAIVYWYKDRMRKTHQGCKKAVKQQISPESPSKEIIQEEGSLLNESIEMNSIQDQTLQPGNTTIYR